MAQKRRVGKKRKRASKVRSRTKTKVKHKLPKDLRGIFTPGAKDLLVRMVAKSLKGKCYSALNCPANMVIATNSTILDCNALAGSMSWKGNWKGATCIQL